MTEYNLSPEKDLEICRVLTGWDALEKRLHGPTVIDFNLPGFSDPGMETRYQDRLSVLEDLVRLQKDPEVIASPPVAQKLRAQEAFLRNVMGEHWPFKQYVEATMGFTPRQYTEQEIQAQREDLRAALADAGVSADGNLKENLKTAEVKIPEAGIREFYEKIAAANAVVLEPVIGAIPPFSLTIGFEEVDAYWSNWVDGGGSDYRLRFNRHNVKEHMAGKSALLAFHEISSHLVQAAMMRDRIERGVLPRCMGLTTVHGPEQFQSEGLAQSVTYFLDTPEARDPFVVAQLELYNYEGMIDNNMHIMLNTGCSLEECVDYGIEHMPYETRADIAHSLASKMNNPQFRVYEHVYGASAIFFKRLAESTTPEQKQQVLNRVYNEWLSAGEMEGFRRELAAQVPKSAPVRSSLPLPSP